MQAHLILSKAAELVDGDRDRTHGEKLRNHENIAQLWNAYLRIRDDPPNLRVIGIAPLTAHDVALMMALLKIARTQLGEHNPDNYVDLAGYAACAGEIAESPDLKPMQVSYP